MDAILNEPKTRQQMIDKMNQERIDEFQESKELTTLLEKEDLRVQLLQHVQSLQSHNRCLFHQFPLFCISSIFFSSSNMTRSNSFLK